MVEEGAEGLYESEVRFTMLQSLGHRRDIILMDSQELLLPEQEYTHQHGSMDGAEVHNGKL